MSNRSGIIYETDRGDFGLAIHIEQEEVFERMNKVYLKLFVDSLCTKPKTHPVTERQICVLKDASRLKMIGYSD